MRFGVFCSILLERLAFSSQGSAETQLSPNAPVLTVTTHLADHHDLEPFRQRVHGRRGRRLPSVRRLRGVEPLQQRRGRRRALGRGWFDAQQRLDEGGAAILNGHRPSPTGIRYADQSGIARNGSTGLVQPRQPRHRAAADGLQQLWRELGGGAIARAVQGCPARRHEVWACGRPHPNQTSSVVQANVGAGGTGM